MKRYDRRTFLKLSGASAVMLALAGCEDECFGGSGAPDVPDSGSSVAPSTYDPFTVRRSPPLALRFRSSRFAPYSGDPGRQKDL